MTSQTSLATPAERGSIVRQYRELKEIFDPIIARLIVEEEANDPGYAEVIFAPFNAATDTLLYDLSFAGLSIEDFATHKRSDEWVAVTIIYGNTRLTNDEIYFPMRLILEAYDASYAAK